MVRITIVETGGIAHTHRRFFNAYGVAGFPFFGRLILDCLNRTEKAKTQAHAFKAAELCLTAQKKAVKIAGL